MVALQRGNTQCSPRNDSKTSKLLPRLASTWGISYTTNVYNPAALFDSVSTRGPSDPIHAQFVSACAEGQRQSRLDHLIRRGANVDHRDNMQGTPIHHAAFAGHVEIVRYLLDAGARIYQSLTKPLYRLLSSTRTYNLIPDIRLDILFSSPGALAACFGHVDVVEWLLDQPSGLQLHETANSTATNRCPSGALDTQLKRMDVSLVILAVSRLQVDMLRFVLERGSDARCLDSLQRNAGFWIGEALISAIDDIGTSTAYSDCLSLLLKCGLHIEDRDHQGWTALIHAASTLRFNVTSVLLDQGAFINATDDKDRTALMLAARAGLAERTRTRFIQFLCERGADANLKDAAGRTALDHAEVRRDCDEVRRVLLDYSYR